MPSLYYIAVMASPPSSSMLPYNSSPTTYMASGSIWLDCYGTKYVEAKSIDVYM